MPGNSGETGWQENKSIEKQGELKITPCFYCAEGISQAGMLAFQFGAAREREKLTKRVSHR